MRKRGRVGVKGREGRRGCETRLPLFLPSTLHLHESVTLQAAGDHSAVCVYACVCVCVCVEELKNCLLHEPVTPPRTCTRSPL